MNEIKWKKELPNKNVYEVKNNKQNKKERKKEERKKKKKKEINKG